MPDEQPAGESLESLLAARRGALPAQLRAGLSPRPWGLALSGGGIRSATFCFGLIKSLAASGVFHRFDYLSTVSGGGYIGSTVGKLFHDAADSGHSAAPAVESALADCETRWFSAWLRANGRYLIPRGMRDILFAGATFSRNLLAIHFEFGMLAVLLGCMLVGLDLQVWGWADCLFSGRDCWHPAWADMAFLGAISGWPTPWLALPLIAWFGALFAAAYWSVPAQGGRVVDLQHAATAVLAAAGLLLLLRHSTGWGASRLPDIAGNLQLPAVLVGLMAALLCAWIAGVVLAACLSLVMRANVDRLRNRLTAALAWVLRLGLVVLVLGLVDDAAWQFANLSILNQGGFAAALGLLAVALRVALPKIADLPKSLAPPTRGIVLAVIDAAGMLVVLGLLIFWVALVHRATSGVLFSQKPAELRFAPAWQWLAWFFVPPLLMVLLSARNRAFLNRSSLYTFYRARLIRSYLGAANASRLGVRPMAQVSPGGGIVDGRVDVTDVQGDDDLPMAGYAPQGAGGPVHLINVCVNQTHDSTGGLFNQDRKGMLLTVAPGGLVCTRAGEWEASAAAAKLTLGSWVAISGAAVAPGLGSSTRSGVAALLMLAGIRLGYWWDSGTPGARIVGKYGQFLDELTGRFDGSRRRDWYLSDGGHFENTAAYALLREECELIVLADCGADPRYAFGDLENLVRKARIDLQADITFLRPRGPHQDLPATFGSLNELASADSQACLAMARVNYRRSNAVGHLLIVKPNMCHGTPVDLVNFKADHPLFPQEPTTDQFFSEAQWESYFELGKTLGSKIQLKQLATMAEFAAEHFVDDDGAVLVADGSGKLAVQFPAKRLSSRIASTGAVSASVSLGAITSIGLATWQAVSSEINANKVASHIEPASFKELTEIFGKLPPEGTPADDAQAARLGEMATALLRVGDAVCSPQNLAAFRQSELMHLMVTRTKKACAESKHQHPSCEALLNDDKVSPCLQDRPRIACVPRYWTRDYMTATTVSANCWDPDAQRAPAAPAPSPAPPPPPPAGAEALYPPGPAAPVPPVSAASASAAPPPQPCSGQTIYVQIYGPELRDSVQLLRDPWRALGASVPPVEDVWDTARRTGRRAPQPYAVPTVIYQDAGSIECARQLPPQDADPPWKVMPLPDGIDGKRGVIEVWIPSPRYASATAPGQAYCYQEDAHTDGPQRFGVHCHATLEKCKSARGDNKRRLQSACELTDLQQAGNPVFLRGWAGSWYLMSPAPFGAPFPQLPSGK